jgi:hypothetical protein
MTFPRLHLRTWCRTVFDLFFDWLAPNHPTYPLLGVFWIRFLVGVRRCRSRVKGLSLIPFSKKQTAITKKCPWQPKTATTLVQ